MALEFTKSTDEEHEIELEPVLVYANWNCGLAIGGQTASLEVGTSFVGHGAPIKVKGESENGKKLGKIEGKVRGDKFVGELPIPEDIELDDQVFFEVKLPKNGLSGDSNRIPAVPPISVTGMKWSASEARRGDILSLTANVEGLRDNTEVMLVVYEHDADGAHDQITELPATVKDRKIEVKWEYQYHEDTDEVLTQEELEPAEREYNPPEYFFTVKVEDAEYGRDDQASGLLTFKDYIDLEFLERDGTPRKNEKYKITFADDSEKEGNLDDEGRARIDDIPPGPYRVEFPDSPGTQRHDDIDEEQASDTQTDSEED